MQFLTEKTEVGFEETVKVFVGGLDGVESEDLVGDVAIGPAREFDSFQRSFDGELRLEGADESAFPGASRSDEGSVDILENEAHRSKTGDGRCKLEDSRSEIENCKERKNPRWWLWERSGLGSAFSFFDSSQFSRFLISGGPGGGESWAGTRGEEAGGKDESGSDQFDRGEGLPEEEVTAQGDERWQEQLHDGALGHGQIPVGLGHGELAKRGEQP